MLLAMEIVLVLLAVAAGIFACPPIRDVLCAGIAEWAGDTGASVVALVLAVLAFAVVFEVVVRGAPHP
jgi:hypothetical protein